MQRGAGRCSAGIGFFAGSSCAKKIGIRRGGTLGHRLATDTSVAGATGREGVEMAPVRATTAVVSVDEANEASESESAETVSDSEKPAALHARAVGGSLQTQRHLKAPATSEEVAISFRGAFSACAITLVTVCGNFLTVLDQSILDVSIVAIAEDLGSDLTNTQWIITAYYLANCGFLPIAGRLGDRFSKTRVYLVGVFVFGLMSLACAQATNLPMLIAFRCVQGIGASFIMGNTMAIVTHFTTLQTRGTAIGYNIVTVGLALSAGPVIGGVVTEYAGWRTLFYINIPICIGSMVLFWLLVPDTPFQASSIDWVGSALVLLTVGALIFSVNQLGSEFARSSPGIYSGSAFGSVAVLMLATCLWHRYARAPLLPRFLLGSKAAMMSIGNQFFMFYAVALLRFTMPTYLQVGLSLSPSETGLAMLAQPIAMIIAGPIAGCLSKRFPARVLATIGTTAFGFGLVMFGFALESVWVIIVVTFLGSCGIPLFNVPNARFILSSMAPEFLGIAGGLLQMTRSMALPLGIASANLLVETFYASMTGGEHVAEVETGNATCGKGFDLANSSTVAAGVAFTTSAFSNASMPCLDADAYSMATQYTSFVLGGISFIGVACSALRGTLVEGHVGKLAAATTVSNDENSAQSPASVESPSA